MPSGLGLSQFGPSVRIFALVRRTSASSPIWPSSSMRGRARWWGTRWATSSTRASPWPLSRPRWRVDARRPASFITPIAACSTPRGATASAWRRRGSADRCRAGQSVRQRPGRKLHKTLKHEEVYLHDYATVQDAIDRLPYFLEEVYNRKRLHSSLGYRPPGGVRGPTCADCGVGQFGRTRLSTLRGSLQAYG